MHEVRNILAALAIATGMRVDTIRYGGMAKPIVHVRHVASWLIRNLLGSSYPDIGLAMGRQDHSTVIHACRAVDRDIRNGGPRFDILLTLLDDINERTRT